MTEDRLLTKKDLAKLIGGGFSVRGVEELMKARKIPCIRIGHKTVRFRWSAVSEALNKFEVKAE